MTQPDLLTGFYGFVAERIRRGAMIPTAVHRANTLLRSVGKEDARRFGRFDPTAPSTGIARSGPYRVERIELALANAYVTQFHRHLNGVVGHLASFGLYDDAGLRGVLILGRPLARQLDDGGSAEVLRLCSDGSRNACSKLYGAARRYARQAGLTRIVTYTLPEEPGASLRAAGFVGVGRTAGGSWSRTGRERADKAPLCAKQRWELVIQPVAKPKASTRCAP